MSLGLGVLLSTVLVLVTWQIEKRNVWRKAGKVSLWLLGAVALVAGAAYCYFGWWADVKLRRANDREIAQIRNPTGLAYWGIHLGMSKADVRYLKGEPSENTPATDNSREQWKYAFQRTAPQNYYTVQWDKTGTLVAAIGCEGSDRADCEAIVGLGPGSSESDVRATLGKPDEDNPPDDGAKSLVYGTGKDKLLIALARDKVYALLLMRTRENHK